MSHSLRTIIHKGAILAVAFSVIAGSFAPLIPSTVQAAGFSYTVSIAGANFVGNTLTVSAPIDVIKFVGTETSQWVKVSWGDGIVEVLQAKLQTNYVKSLDGKNFSIHNFVRSHTYGTNGSFSVTVKVYHGNESGNEGSASESNSVTFQTENTLVLCTDGIDNDHDGLVDALDPDCAPFQNHAPVANSDSYATNEDTALTAVIPGVLSNDTDADGDALTAVLVAGPLHGSLTLNTDGSFTYTPDLNWNGTDTFTYKANDGSVDGNTATVTITVGSDNDVPVAVADPYSTNEDTVLVVTASGVLTNDTDADGDTLSAILVGGPSNGTLSLSTDGSFTYTPNTNWSGTDSFTYKANDGSADSGTVSVTITVTPVNDAPTATPGSVTTSQNVPVSDTVVGGDVDGDTLTFATTSSPIHGSVTAFNPVTGAFTYTPDTNYIGGDTFSFTATDGTLTSAPAAVTIAVNAVAENTSNFCADGIDNDNDDLIDLADPDCAAFVPVIPPPSNDGGNGGGGGGGGGVISGPLSIGFVNSNAGGGQVLGASTDLPSGCSAYLNGYLRRGAKNDPEQVKKLQTFLNDHMQAGLPITGVFGPKTFDAVNAFQMANWDEVLKPWVAFGLPTDHTATGYVYKTTRHKINLLQCVTLNEPAPQLP
jgi:VCBS repeat-containing protein